MRGVGRPVPVYRMGGTNRLRTRRRYLRSRRLHGSRRAVVAVVGTLLALLVFFALFGVFLTQYVPLWMTENESQFTNQATASFTQFQGSVDSQYVLGSPPTYGTPFTMSSQSIPLFAQPTQGSLAFLQSNCPKQFAVSGARAGQPVDSTHCVFQNVTLSAGPGGGPVYQSAASGTLTMVLPNRYYSGQTFFFQDDAVVQSQGGAQQVLVLPPLLNVTTIGGNTTVYSSFLQLSGNSGGLNGQGTQQVYSHLSYAQKLTSNGSANGTALNFFRFEVGTPYPCAWAHDVQSMMNSSGVGDYSINYWANWSAALPPVTSTSTTQHYLSNNYCTAGSGQTTVVLLTISNVNYAVLFSAGIQVSLGVGGS